ncbi:MAG TPA: hypothetical protein V6D04_00910 [Candidatus Obscuribacterales bacterium]
MPPISSRRNHRSKPSPDPWLSLATLPVLAALIGGKALAEWVQELGEMSEEVFRGDRLPTIDFPSPEPMSSETSD